MAALEMTENAVPDRLSPAPLDLSTMSADDSNFDGFTPAEILLIYNEAWCVL